MLHSKKGSALIIALVISIIGITLTLFVIKVSRNILFSSRMLMDKLYATLQAESTIEEIKFYASTGRFYPEYISNAIPSVRYPQRIYLDGRREKINKKTEIIIQDAGAKLNVWSPYTNAMSSLLREEGVVDRENATIIRDSLLDWYDKDNLKHLNGAEGPYYRFNLGVSYTPRNFPGVQSIDELHLVRGLTDERVFKKLRPNLILTYRWMPNLNTVNTDTLAALLKIPKAIAQQVVHYRKVKGFLTAEDIRRITSITVSPSNFRFFPSFTLDIKVASLFNTAGEKIHCVVSFILDEHKPFRVLKWVE